MNFASQSALRISLFYVVVAVFWIGFSDMALALAFPAELVTRMQTLKGSLFVLATGVLLFVLIRRSLTREIAIRASQSESEHRWRELIDHNLHAIVLVGDDRLLYCNRAAADLFGAEDKHELRKCRWDDLLVESDGDGDAASKETVEKPFSARRCTIRRLDGAHGVVEVHPTSVRLGGERVTLAILIDMREREEYERMLIRSRKDAEDLAEMKESILTNMSHEIRTPLTGIIGIAEVLGREFEDEVHDLIELLRESAWRLARTLDSVLTLAQLQSGSAEINPRPVDLGRDVEKLVRSLEPLANEKRIRLRFTAPSEKVVAQAEPAALDQVVTNLISNAIKFTDEGEVSVAVGTDRGHTYIDVRDTGIGISREFLPHAFDEYRQESHGINRDYEGSGLGLTIAKRLIELMDGEIVLESQKGIGTSVRAMLPLAYETTRPDGSA